MSLPIKFLLCNQQLGGHYILKALIPEIKKKLQITHHQDLKSMAAQLNLAAAKTLSLAEGFADDQEMLKTLKHLKYELIGLDDTTKLSLRSFEHSSLIHIDLRLIRPKTASAVEPHLQQPSSYLTWEELMCDLLEMNNIKNIKHIHISGLRPDCDRNIFLNLNSDNLRFHLNSTQETLQYTLALLYNCIEVLEER